jgi:hypothetical protein
LAWEAKKLYRFLAWDSPAKAVRMFFSVWVPFKLFIFVRSEGSFNFGINKNLGRWSGG